MGEKISGTNRRQAWLARLSRVYLYIRQNLDDELDLNQLAELAAFSPYHFHRIWRGLYGCTVAESVRRLRLQRAANDLMNSQMAMIHVARRAGYRSVAAFHRAFVSSYRLTPARYRRYGLSKATQCPPIQQGNDLMLDVQIRTLQAQSVLALKHRGAYMEISQKFMQLGSWAAQHHLFNERFRMLGIYEDDPTVVPADQLTSWAAMIVAPDAPMAPDMQWKEIPAGPHAVAIHKGPYVELINTYGWLYGTWLPQSGYTPAEFPSWEIYLNDASQVAPAELLTEIYMPLAALDQTQ